MRSLFAFLWKYQFTVLFIFLESIALVLLFNSYTYHKSLAFNTVNDLTGSVFSMSTNVSDYFSLKTENEQLLEENARLRNLLHNGPLFADTVSQKEDSLYQYITAKVVSNSVDNRNNFIMINKGSLDGIEKELGVISSTGLTGIVVGVSRNYAYIMSMLHQNSRISARIKKSNQLVNVTWSGLDYRTGEVIDIPSHIILSPGDTIVTSGNSLIFPEGIEIGTIISQEKTPDKALGNAKLVFSTDFNSLSYVYVIRNLSKEEQQILMNQADE
jgi:rod shape-determining protein MreC